jgi:hypothetical protein
VEAVADANETTLSMAERPPTAAAEELLDLVTGLAPLRDADARTVFSNFIRPIHSRFEQIHAEYVHSFAHIRSALASAGDDVKSTSALVTDRLWLSEAQRIKVRAAVEVFTDVVWERDAEESRIAQMGQSSEGDLELQGPLRYRFSEPPSNPSAVFMPYCDAIYRYLTAGHDGRLSWDGGLWGGMSQRWYLSVLQALAIAASAEEPPSDILDSLIKGTSLSLKDKDRLGRGVFAQRLVDSIAVLLQRHYAVAVSEYLTLASTLSTSPSMGSASPGEATLNYQRLSGVFISYSHDDKPFAWKLRDRLDAIKVRVWLDEKDLLPGERILDAVSQAIQEHDKLLLCCSKTSLESWWVKDEVRKALAIERREKRNVVIPLDLDAALFSWTDGLAEDIRSRSAVDFQDWDKDEDKFNRGVERLSAVLAGPGESLRK